MDGRTVLDTPRTLHRKEICRHRLLYYSGASLQSPIEPQSVSSSKPQLFSKKTQSSADPSSSPTKLIENNRNKSIISASCGDNVLETMLTDNRVNVERQNRNKESSFSKLTTNKHLHVTETRNGHCIAPSLNLSTETRMCLKSGPSQSKEFHLQHRQNSALRKMNEFGQGSHISVKDYRRDKCTNGMTLKGESAGEPKVSLDDDEGSVSKMECNGQLQSVANIKSAQRLDFNGKKFFKEGSSSLTGSTASDLYKSNHFTDVVDVRDKKVLAPKVFNNPRDSIMSPTLRDANCVDDISNGRSVINIQTNSSLYKSVDTANVKTLLGQERFERMLKNFKDCSDDDDDVAISSSDIDDDDDGGDLELRTHRPEATAVHFNYLAAQNPVGYPTVIPQSETNQRMQPSVKCAFAAEEIYREASAFSDVLSDCTNEVNSHSLQDDYYSSVSDVSSSMIGREITTVRQRPFGPIPQKSERSMTNQNSRECHHPKQIEVPQTKSVAGSKQVRISEWFSHDADVNQTSHNALNDCTESEDMANDEINHKETSLCEGGKRKVKNISKTLPGPASAINGDTSFVSDVTSEVQLNADMSGLYSEVTSAISQDGTSGLTERMERLGISLEFLKKSTPEPNYVVEKIVPVKILRQGTTGQAMPEPATSLELPKPSVSDACPDKKCPDLVKICPKCAGINRSYMDWCTQCGEVLIGIDPVPASSKDVEQHRIKMWIASDIQADQEINQDQPSPFKTNTADGGSLKDEHDGQKEVTISRPTKDELCLNLRTSCETIDLEKKTVKNAPNRSEEMLFVYEDSNNAVKPLPVDLRAELSINLEDSQTTAAMSDKVNKKSQSDEAIEELQKSNGGGKEKFVLEKGTKKKQCEVKVQAQNINYHLIDYKDVMNPEDVQIDDPVENEDTFKEFVSRLKSDSRFKQSAEEPKKSASLKRRPRSAGCRRSLVADSIDKAQYTRKWQTSSSAWKSRDVSPILHQARSKEALHQASGSAPSLNIKRGTSPENLIVAPPKQQRPYSAGRLRTSHGRRVVSGGQSLDENLKSSPSNCRRNDVTTSAKSQGGSTAQSLSQSKAYSVMVDMGKYMTLAQGYTGKLYEKDNISDDVLKQAPSRKHLSQHKIELMSPRIQIGELSMLLCLPEEIILKIFSYLSHADLIRCAAVCTSFKRIALDPCLWKKIVLKKRELTDSWMIEIGSKKPESISFIQCTGNKVTTAGLRELFRQCADHLQELNFTGCQQGHLTGQRILLHVTNRCRYLTHVDGSWTNIDDCGVMALADSCHRLETLCLNGCPTISDEALHLVVIKHGTHLKTLELFGCFNLTQAACSSITKYCKGLITLNLGQCWKIPDTSLCQLTASLGQVEHLDLRGCKQMKDSCVWHIVRNCPHLETLALANCPNLTDSALTEIATMASNIKSLDVCGCKKLTDVGIKALAKGCHCLQYLDVSTTAITHKGVTSLANYCNHHLEVFKINFCKQITVSCLMKLARHCHRLKKLYLYGLTGIRDTNKIMQENAGLWVEM